MELFIAIILLIGCYVSFDLMHRFLNVNKTQPEEEHGDGIFLNKIYSNKNGELLVLEASYLDLSFNGEYDIWYAANTGEKITLLLSEYLQQNILNGNLIYIGEL